MKSIRRELSVRLVVGAAVLLLVASGLLGFAIHVRIVAEFDRALEAKTRALVSLTSRERDRIEVDYEEDELPEEVDEDEAFLHQVLFEDGRVIHESEDLEGVAFTLDLEGARGIRFSNTELPEGEAARLAYLRFRPRFDLEDELAEGVDEAIDLDLFQIPAGIDPEAARVIVVVVRSRDALDGLLLFLYGTLAGMDILLLVGIFYVAKSSIRKGLAPIADLNERIGRIDPSAEGQRVVLEGAPEELRTILNALNSLLGKVQEAFGRERRFSSAVAHELRTPVAELRMACEAGKMYPNDVECVTRLFKDNHDIALHMERIVSSLLELTRCDNRTASVSLEELELDELVRECWKRSSDVVADRKLTLEDRIDPNERVISDRGKLEMIFQNLVDNAISYSPTGSVVVFSSYDSDGRLSLMIENETSNLSQADLDRVFDRFWRKDPARTVGNHAGLGLSLVKALADLLSIEVKVELVEERIFRVRLRFLERALGNDLEGEGAEG